MQRLVVCSEGELGPGQMKTVWRGRTPIVVACSGRGEYYAVRGFCPHQGALLGRGRLWPRIVSGGPGEGYGLEREAEILRCPWHAFDFDLDTGRCLGDPGLRVKTYPARLEDGQIIVEI